MLIILSVTLYLTCNSLQVSDDYVLGTALAIALLEECFKDQEPEWMLLRLKAKTFIKSLINDQEMEALLKQIKSKLATLRQQQPKLLLFAQ